MTVRNGGRVRPRALTATALALAALATPAAAVTTLYDYTGAIVQVTLGPGYYRLAAGGAQGGESRTLIAGGLGAQLSGRFHLASSETLDILVGGAGSSDLDTTTVVDGRTLRRMGGAGGGGGGSFVVVDGGAPLLIAGGGGGAGQTTSAFPSRSAGVTTPDGATIYPGELFFSGVGASGTNGNGGAGGHGVDVQATCLAARGGGGGGGYLTNGGAGGVFPGSGGASFLAGGAGGNSSAAVGGHGGFGGGGEGSISSTNCGAGGAGGGGGGYSGGGGASGGYGGSYGTEGAGGGSYVDGRAVLLIEQSGANPGNGYVSIADDVPEPAAWLLMALGTGFTGIMLRRARGGSLAA